MVTLEAALEMTPPASARSSDRPITAPTPLARVGEKDGGLIHSASINTAPGDSHQVRPTRPAMPSHLRHAAGRGRLGGAPV